MATTNFNIDQSKRHGMLLHTGLTNLEQGFQKLNQVLQNIPHMIDGDGSDDAHYTEVTARYGFPSNAVSHAAWNELNSVMFKLNTNESVSSVNAAILQAFAKFR